MTTPGHCYEVFPFAKGTEIDRVAFGCERGGELRSIPLCEGD